MPDFVEVVGVDSVGFVVVGLAFEPVEDPISPVDICFPQVPDQKVPGDIGGIGSKFSQEKRNTGCSDVGHIFEHFLFELFVAPALPAQNKP